MASDNPTDDNARTRVVDSDAPQALVAGTQLGRYRIESVLGQGGFGITYRATDTSLDRPVAIKEFLPLEVAIRIDGSTVVPRTRKDGADYEWGLQRFLEEAKMLARHEAVPNMVRVYDFVEANGTAYMVMALATGDNLATVLRLRGTLPEAELKAIALPLLDGLGRLHEAGLVHRDIKPANIILSASGAPTLIDFGAARQALGRLSRSITSIVTPGYAPFEQYGSAGEQGPWTDIYALAATLYHGVTGKPPPDSVDRIRRDPMVPALQAGGGRYTEGFLLAIDAGLKVDETERPQSAEQWRALLTEGSPAIAPVVAQPAAPSAAQPVSRPPSRQPSQPVSAPPSQQSISQAPPPAARAGSRKTMIAAGVAAVVIAGGAAVALTMGSSSTPNPPPVAQPATPDPAIQAAAAEKQRMAELEKRLAEEAESRRKLEAQIAEAEAKRKAEEETRRKAAEEARLKAEAEAREKSEAENRRRIEEETRKKVEAEFKAKAEEEARKRQEEEAKRKDEEAKKKADEEQKRKIEDERRKKEEIRLAADSDKRKAEEARASVSQPAAGPVGAPVTRPTSTEQVAAAPPSIDRAAFEARHGEELRRRAEQILARGATYTVPTSGYTVSFRQLTDVRVVSVTPTEVALDVSYIVAGTRADLETAERASIRLRNQSGFPLMAANYRVSSGAPAGTPVPQPAPQVAATPAAPPPPADPAAYVAQHWNVMRPQVEAALARRGVVVDAISGIGMRFSEIFNYRLVSATADTIVVTVNYRNTRAVQGSGHATGNYADISENATFRNQPPAFPLVGMQRGGAAAAVATPAPQQVAAAYVAQHWPTMKAGAEAFLARRGAITHPHFGRALTFSTLVNSYKVVSVTPAAVSLEITMVLVGSVPGGSAILATTAVFQNQPPGFPVIRID